MNIKRLLIARLEEILCDLRTGKLACDEEQMEAALKAIAHRPVSAYEAYTNILHISRSTFNEYVAQGKLPKGVKRQGWNELRWYEDELIEAKDKLNQYK